MQAELEMADLVQQQSSKREKFIKNPIISALLAVICCALWGSAFPFIKLGYVELNINSQDWKSQILFAGIRFFIAGVFVILFGSLISKKILLPKKNSIKNILTLSVFQTVIQYVFFYIGLANTTGTKGAVLNSTSVFFTVLVSALIFKQEKLNANKILGCIIGFAGTVIINFTQGGFSGSFSFIGEGFIIICSLSYAFSCVLIKIYGENENPVILSGYQFMAGGFVMTVFALITGAGIESFTFKGILILFYLAVLSAAAYTLWGILLKYNHVSKIAVFGFMTPIFGCVFSALFLKENIIDSALKTFISLLLVCGGIILVNYKKGAANND